MTTVAALVSFNQTNAIEFYTHVKCEVYKTGIEDRDRQSIECIGHETCSIHFSQTSAISFKHVKVIYCKM